MATKKTLIDKATGTPTVAKQVRTTSRRPAHPEPAYVPTFNSVKERLAYIYGTLTPEDSLRILYKAGILTPSGRLSSKFK